MSRGMGAVQRRILKRLPQNTADPLDDFWEDLQGIGHRSWTTVLELAGENPTRAQIESTRRAVLKLHAAGLVDINYVRRRVPASTSAPTGGRAAATGIGTRRRTGCCWPPGCR